MISLTIKFNNKTVHPQLKTWIKNDLSIIASPLAQPNETPERESIPSHLCNRILQVDTGSTDFHW